MAWRIARTISTSIRRTVAPSSRSLVKDLFRESRLGCTKPFSTDTPNGHTEKVQSQDISVCDEFSDDEHFQEDTEKVECTASDDEESEENTEKMESTASFLKKATGQFGPRGVHKAILLGEVGSLPIQKTLKTGRVVTVFSLGTGGMFNNRKPLEGESRYDYEKRGSRQWHRVVIYQDRAGQAAMQHMVKGSYVYLEGSIELRVFVDPATKMLKRIREIAVRHNGRMLFMGPQPQPFVEVASALPVQDNVP